MKLKKSSAYLSYRIWALEIVSGIILLCLAFWISIHADISNAAQRLSSTVNYVKEQCNNNQKMELASETKSLMRIMESAEYINWNLASDMEKSGFEEPDQTLLENYAKESYVTGILLLSPQGAVEQEYHTDERNVWDLYENIDAEALLDVWNFPEKTYASRVNCEDGSYIDLAAVGRTDRSGILVAYYHTSKEYCRIFVNSMEQLLTGYSVKHDGTIVISNGEEIVASNDSRLVGVSMDDNEILRTIRRRAEGSKLVRVRDGGDTGGRSFGLMEQSRNYYIYAYMPERGVFNKTPQNMLFVALTYLLVLIIINMVRWQTEKKYQKQKLQIQQEYAQRLENKNLQLEESVKRETKANSAKTDFLARMTHDIRTPLNGIIGLLKMEEIHPDDLELLHANREKMLVSADHLLSLINDMLQMSKLENNEIVLAQDAMDLNALLMDVVTIVEQRAADAGITLEYDKASDKILYPYVYGSPLHVRQIFLNIYGNCIKYNRIGGKVITHLDYLGTADGMVHYRWVISDTGIGMSENFLEHIYEPFVQEHSDARSVYHGTGLGMAIVKRLIDEMNGTIQVTSQEGKGSTFVVVLPFKIAEKEKVVQPEAATGEASIRGLHLLLAEDNELNAEIAARLLNDEGATVQVVRDGQQAIDAFASRPQGTYDAILMDIMMPKIDGYTATRVIRSTNRQDAKAIPIIAMTAHVFDEDVKQCLEAGMNAHLPKPLQMETVGSTIARLCKRKK